MYESKTSSGIIYYDGKVNSHCTYISDQGVHVRVGEYEFGFLYGFV